MGIKKVFFAFLFSCAILVGHTQSKIVSDNRILDSLTRKYTTYSLVLLVNDSISSDNSRGRMNTELRTQFSFLRKKKFRAEGGEITITIRLKGAVVGSLDYQRSSQNNKYGTNYQHKYFLDHRVSADLKFAHNKINLYSMQLADDIVITRKYSYSETNSDYSWMKDQSEAAAARLKDQQSASKGYAGLSVIFQIKPDFFDVFDKYLTEK